MKRNTIIHRIPARSGLDRTLGVVLGLALALSFTPAKAREGTPADLMGRPSTTASSASPLDYLSLPLAFEANQGQAGRNSDFLVRGESYLLQLDATGARLRLHPHPGTSSKGRHGSAEVRMQLSGAEPRARAVPSNPLDGRVNYLLGKDPQMWRTGLPLYERVRYEGVYPGIDVVYYGRQRLLEYDFIVAPGAEPSAIVLEFKGAKSLHLDESGDLVLVLDDGEVRFLRPEIYQESGHGRDRVPGRYVVGTDRSVRFAIGAYDVARPLIIDPVLTYSTFLSGSNVDEPFDVAVDDQGHAYIAGYTWSVDFPATAGAYDDTCGVAGECGDIQGFDAFVTKLSPDGSSLVWSTFLGGTAGDIAHGIIVDDSGRVIVTGTTRSTDFPVTANATQPSPGSSPVTQDAFLSALTTDGTGLLFSTYLGGADAENHTTDYSGIASRGTGDICVTGVTESNDFPATTGAHDTTLGGSRDAFVACYDLFGATPSRTFATFLGGSSFEGSGGIAMDTVGGIYIAGWTSSTDFPTSSGAFDTSLSGLDDGFVVKFDASGNRVYASLIGGSTRDVVSSVAVDTTGNALVTGWRASAADFPTTPGAFDTVSGWGFLTKFNTTATSLVYSTFIPDTNPEDIAVDGAGRPFIIGSGWGLSFPTTGDAYSMTRAGNTDVTLSTFSSDGSSLVYGTYLGGATLTTDNEKGRGIALDSNGNPYLVGITGANQWANVPFPTTPTAFDRAGGESWSGFVARFGGFGGSNQADLAIAQTDVPDPVGLYSLLTYTITVTNLGIDEANAIVVTETLPGNVYFNNASGVGWSCDGSANPVVCNRALLASGATAPDLVIEVTPTAAVGTFTATAAVSAHESDPDPSNNMAAVDSIVDAPDCVDSDGDSFVACFGDCNPPTGLTCGDCGEFDPATYPGAPELCDFYDNDCDGEYDEGLGPQDFGDLSMDTGERLRWLPVAGATAYDVARGDLGTLQPYGDVNSGSVCLAENQSALEHTDGLDPALGTGFWYLMRPVDPGAGSCGTGSYESGGAAQSGSRDGWILYWPCQ